MATAEELLAATGASDQILTIDLNTREIKIPDTVRNLGVESDDDVKRIYFRMPKQYGEFDMSEFDIRVNYMNAKQEGGIYVINDVAVNDTENTLTFSWLVDRHVAAYVGDVVFNVCMKILDSDGVVVKEFNTTTATLPVKVGLETEEAVVEDNPSAFDSVLARLYAVEAANELGKDGHYSIVKIVENDNDIVFTLINQDGETEAVIKQGYVPIKGVDYWTEDDKRQVYNYISTWAPTVVYVTLTATEWDSNNQQTVTVNGVTKDSIVFATPDISDSSYDEYINRGVTCVGQAIDELTFKCEYLPTVDVVASVAVFYSSAVVADGGGGGGIASVTDDGNGNVYLV